jgi:hypothetical protein
MTPGPALHSRWIPIFLLAGSLAGSVVQGSLASAGQSPNRDRAKEAPIHIEVRDARGLTIAATRLHATLSTAAPVALSFDREYRPGDRIVIAGPRAMAMRLDESMPECQLYLPDPSQSNFSYEIPYGRAEEQTGSAYAPRSFQGNSHRVTVRVLNRAELAAYRNLALNPCDFLPPEQDSAQAFPHSSSNSVFRDRFDFAARNAIDGNTQNGHHGVWPYESWGPELRTDLWWKVDFGRIVSLDKVRLMVRADFPHDSYWKSAGLEFSDGSRIPIRIAPSAEFQEFAFPSRRVSWLRIANLVPADPARWCSFIEVEAWGRDLP